MSLYVALIKKGVQGADAPAKTLLTEWGDYLEQALPAAYEFLIDKFPSVRSGGVNGKAVSNNGQANTTPTPPSSRQFEVNPQGNSVTINNKEYTVNTDGVLDLSSLKKISAAEIEVLGEMKNLRKLYLNGLTTLGVLQARALGEMKKLYELRLTGVPSLSDEEKMRLDGSASLKVYAWKQATIVLR